MIEILTGRTEAHLVLFGETGMKLHADAVGAVEALFADARDAGFDLRIASSFRSFDRQCMIWNEKANGRRPVLDDLGQPLDVATLSDEDLVFRILRWSALPGASRHHWGTDFDYFDASQWLEGDQLRLIPSEYEGSGPFARANSWLSANLAKHEFFRPYAEDRGGVAPEPWHLSFRPLADDYLRIFNFEAFESYLALTDFKLNDVVRIHAREIYERFVMV